ncbi:lysophospholipid acyltransferase family protein [Azorhizobium doebereinerae]|uniref:lysophospholipid acyltransferase family protein n=1 Tax=Azorhizobium doebereinerae TaxID=281091 RepID=UPI000423C9B1|nr:hypothetical protein [Azorhizobium doebereinerae]
MQAGEEDAAGEVGPAGADAARPRKTRKPYVWNPPAVPGWADFRAGGTRRSAFLAYWRGAGLKDLTDFALHAAFRLLPIDVCSAIGGAMGRLVGPRFHKAAAERARANLRRIDPTLTEAEIERRVVSHFDNAGRVMAEFSILHRLVKAGRITVENAAPPLKRSKEGPLIFVACHTGNWEATGALMHSAGLDWSAIYTPPRGRAQQVIADRVRNQFGVNLLPPGKAGIRPTIRTLEEGGAVSMFCDEVHHGTVMAPFFGRPAHVDGNFAIALRFARMTGAQIFIGHCVRLNGARFHVTCSDAVVLPSHTDPDAPLLEDVKALNALLEPIIRANCGQWYFLDNAFE